MHMSGGVCSEFCSSVSSGAKMAFQNAQSRFCVCGFGFRVYSCARIVFLQNVVLEHSCVQQ